MDAYDIYDAREAAYALFEPRCHACQDTGYEYGIVRPEFLGCSAGCKIIKGIVLTADDYETYTKVRRELAWFRMKRLSQNLRQAA